MAANLDNFEIPDRTVTRALRAPTQRRTVGIGPLLDWFATYLSCFGKQPVATLDARKGGVRRDLRIDFLRGVALLVIFTDHVRFNLLSQYTPKNFGFSDMAEVFVFLSGYVCGFSYGRALKSLGFLACQKKAVVRCAQLGVAWILTGAILLLVQRVIPNSVALTGKWATILGPVSSSSTGSGSNLFPGVTTTSVGPLVFGATTEVTWLLGILSLYICLLLILPMMLWLRERSVELVLGMALCCYLAVQLWPGQLDQWLHWSRFCFFNPFAWQFLFFLAAVCSGSPIQLRGISFRNWLQNFVALLLIVAALNVKVTWMPGATIPYTGKVHLEALRLMHFLALTCMMPLMLPDRDSPCWKQAVLRPLILCGQNSLVVFCTGAVLASLGTTVLSHFGSQMDWQIAVNTLGWAGCVLAAWCWCVLRRRGLVTRT